MLLLLLLLAVSFTPLTPRNDTHTPRNASSVGELMEMFFMEAAGSCGLCGKLFYIYISLSGPFNPSCAIFFACVRPAFGGSKIPRDCRAVFFLFWFVLS